MPPTKDGLPLSMLPGDTLTHHYDPQQLVDKIVTGVEDWGEWSGLANQDLKANHVEGQYSVKNIARMNPPKSLLYPVEQAPWQYIRVLRLDLSAFPKLPRYPGTDASFVANLQLEIEAHLGEPYAWNVIGGFVPLGIISRIFPWLGLQIIKNANPLNVLNGHASVCSQWWRRRLEAAVSKTYGFKFDLFDGNIGLGQERPADFQCSRYLNPNF